ncbi:MAG: heavy metal translocating P-type ATPase metal-binding domain-containing protein, partial [Bacteroidetes bacterium]|nr:heavy metal translocating P-type ATPase metal-binding domain-containing protein [Bacteroidota bacterium]
MHTQLKNKLTCFHCGDDCKEMPIQVEQKYFCCEGCKTVYEILNKNDLCEYYNLSENPGIAQKVKIKPNQFSYLENTEVSTKLIHFKNDTEAHVSFYLPTMHCSSCIWLLENLHKLNPAIKSSRTNFLKKEVLIVFDTSNYSLKQVVELLTSIGYEPHINLNDLSKNKTKKHNRSRVFKVGIAGFCFGNIMMLSFPEYFSMGNIAEGNLKNVFNYLNLFLSLPVFIYCASEFYISAWSGLKQKFLNIDAPIVLAIVITFARSVYEITSGTGSGYLDSMSGIVFFMLIGRIFQDKTYEVLSFDRDYKSYFPISVSIKKGELEENIPVTQLKVGNRMIIRNNEIIPADGILFYGKASIDYSFVSGESLPNEKTIGEIIYAGGKQLGSIIELEVVKEVSQSYLTQLWNNKAFKENEQKNKSFVHALAKQFTWVLLSIALTSGIYWYINDSSKILNAITAILLVACPCALLLSATFTNGNLMRILGRNKFYPKNALSIEALTNVDTIVFDKTGTITQSGTADVSYKGEKLSASDVQLINSVVRQSSHPLSSAIQKFLPLTAPVKITNYKEFVGKGIEATYSDKRIMIGSLWFVNSIQEDNQDASKVYIKI